MAPQLNTEIRRFIHVTKTTDGSAYTGIANGSFTKSVQRLTGGTTVSTDSAVVTVTEIGGGDYYWKVTLATASGPTRITIAGPADSVIDIPVWEDDVQAGSTASTGPYLTTRDNYKLALGVTDTAKDARIDQLLPAVTAAGESYCGRPLIGVTKTEYLDGANSPVLTLASFPITSLSLYHSTAVPRVYDSTTLLVDGTNYYVDLDTGIIRRLDGSLFYAAGASSINGWGAHLSGAPTVKAVSVLGYSSIPADLELGAIIWIASMLGRLGTNTFHIASQNRGEGSIAYDTTEFMRGGVPPATRDLWDQYKVQSRAA